MLVKLFQLNQFGIITGQIIKRTKSYRRLIPGVSAVSIIMETIAQVPSSDADTIIEEGQAKIFSPKSVFYNPVQEFNRDLTIAVISEFSKLHFQDMKDCKVKCRKLDMVAQGDFDVPLTPKTQYPGGLRILEGLAATGLRSVRFALEIPGVNYIIANDFDENAVGYIKRNIENNSVSHLIKASHDDASMIMYQNRRLADHFDVIDLDPYGTPSPFLDSAVQAVRDGGLLCVTCTDMAVLSGNSGETSFTKYGSMAIKGKACHEQALRILLQSIQSHAARYSRYIEPLISVSVDFYIRVFVRVFAGQAKAKMSASKSALLYQCVGCGANAFQQLGSVETHDNGNIKYSPARGPPVDRLCQHCNHQHIVGGPLWYNPLHNNDFIKAVISRVEDNLTNFKTANRIIGVMTVICEELPDIPMFFTIDQICGKLRTTPPTMIAFRSALLNAGYRVSLSHAAKNSVKTDAPMSVIWDIMRCWVKDNPVKEHHLIPGTVPCEILKKEPQIQVSFEVRADANPESREKGLLRWQINPEKDWGPKSRAKKSDEESLSEKRLKLQNKRKELDPSDADNKNYPCKRHKQGYCELGDECRYSHDKHVDV